MKPLIATLLVSAVSGIAILCSGCRKQTNENSAPDSSASESADAEISNQLDLELVATLFGESKDLEDFECKLNDPEQRIST